MALVFRGRYPHALDPKGRFSVPRRFRDVLAGFSDGGGNLIVVPDQQCLQVYPLEVWERMEAKVRAKSPLDPRVRDFGRLFMSRARDVELDGAGRVLLPPDTRQQAGLARDVMLVGPGTDFFEIWDRTRFEEYDRQEQIKLPSLLETFSTEFGG